MNLAYMVQYHPARAHLLPSLVARIGGDCVYVTRDPDPDHPVRSALRTYLECLRRFPDKATHLLIVQDDAWPCERFRARVEPFVDRHPDALCPLFVGGQGSPGNAVRRALKRDLSEVELPMGWVPTVALVWPQVAAEGFLAYCARYNPYKQRGDDGPVGTWRCESRVRAVAPVPSLVEHPDDVPSLYRNRAGQSGRNRARVAVRSLT